MSCCSLPHRKNRSNNTSTISTRKKRYGEDDDDDIDKLISEGERMIDYLCSPSGKTTTGLQGFGMGIAGMFGLSGIQSMQKSTNGNSATDFLKKAGSILQQITQYYSLYYAQTQAKIDKELFTLINNSVDLVNSNIDNIAEVLREEEKLLQIEIIGVYIVCAIIIFFLILVM